MWHDILSRLTADDRDEIVRVCMLIAARGAVERPDVDPRASELGPERVVSLGEAERITACGACGQYRREAQCCEACAIMEGI